MDHAVLFGKTVVIPVIVVKIEKLAGETGQNERQAVLLCLQRESLSLEGYRNRKAAAAFETDPEGRSALVVFLLRFLLREASEEEIAVGQEGQQDWQPGDILLVVEQQLLQEGGSSCVQVILVDRDQFPAAEAVRPGEPEEQFHAFLIDPAGSEDFPVGTRGAVQIQTVHSLKGVRNAVLGGTAHQKWEVEAVSVVVDQRFERRGEGKESAEDLFFAGETVREPLPQGPARVLRVGQGADQVDLGGLGRQSCCFNIQEKKIVRVPQGSEGVGHDDRFRPGEFFHGMSFLSAFP